MSENKKIVVSYVPVLHEGYRRFFDTYKGSKLLLLGDDLKQKFVPIAKDLRALPAEFMKKSIEAWGIFSSVEIIEVKDLVRLSSETGLVMPDEDIMREMKQEYLPDTKVAFDSIFLRWDKHKSMINNPIEADQTISSDDSDNEIIKLLRKEAGKSSDWWRHIGAAVVKEGKVVLIGHNHHVPSEQTPYVDGDPRSDFHKGIQVELSTSIHAEAGLIAEAAQKGISLEGTSLYATTFPCPPCAKLIAYSGVKKIYYADGYGVLDGEKILKSRGVEIVFVKGK